MQANPSSAPRTERAVFRTISVRDLSADQLLDLSKKMKLSLSKADMQVVQQIFNDEGRDPTDVELEVIAQTWSEHCKHRIFNAKISHTLDGKDEVVDSLFKTYIRSVTEKIMEQKPDFVLSAFVDNAGFVKLDDNQAVCLKVETHNHPSAIEPYAGANTGLGGVIRDILGAGKGSKPVASIDVFCFGPPDTKQEDLKAKDVIHPLGVMRGVVRGVRDYGNRMGIPTVNGAIQFDDTFIYNPLVFCGTAGVIPIKDIAKEVKPGHLLIAAGGRTGKDGLKGATFSSAELTTDSHEEDQTAVQIGNPIEEKKVADFVLAARDAGLIEFITDCGAGGFSSAAGEMLSEVGGEVWLENCPLKEPGLESWQVFISESQERMVMAIEEHNLPALQKIADTWQSEIFVLAKADGSKRLKVWHHGQSVCDLHVEKLHGAPRREMKAHWRQPVAASPKIVVRPESWTQVLKTVLGDFSIVSREPIIREYDHEVQGNTVLKPLAGASGDAPQDGSVIKVDGSNQLVALACALLPEWGKTDPHAMGRACVDECVRQLVAMGANPERIAILDNFCMGNPDSEKELGALVECTKGMAESALAYGAPFVSGKDSFYNYFITDEGPVSIPVTLLVSGFGVIEDASHVVGSSLRRPGSKLAILGKTTPGLRGSVFAKYTQGAGLNGAPTWSETETWSNYNKYHELVKKGAILATHDLSEGGLAIALAEFAFSGKAGIKVELENFPASKDCTMAEILFGETPGRFLIEVAAEHVEAVRSAGAVIIGESTGERWMHVTHRGTTLIDAAIAELKPIWQNGLVQYY
ncbi:phosphoribosylformylglycinamidine synthase subunit II [Prosthecobacter fusiformis]|uniref:Phosphoribosylformylglycinamidine synthase subunit PurL n=1 Tax=Prosthecobacter fusiformis TaxID=48464 RepID=A0A4R7SQS4_9BACT|nr:phosphoribosylformylglycinamidine synthase subunit PurL [Prosthecobacter fusiformis]TDU81274.1 phosphoribosylformylglycinamidine synthase subunit II [Prosthecobacter fusiformis]